MTCGIGGVNGEAVGENVTRRLGHRLVNKIMARVRKRFAEIDHHPTEDQWRGLREVARSIVAMALGTCEDKFYLSAVPCGIGKTTVMEESIRVLVEEPALAHVGILIMVNELKQIPERIKGMGLEEYQYAVRTGRTNKDLNNMGLERYRCRSPSTGKRYWVDPQSYARVVFTTQQKIKALKPHLTFMSAMFKFWSHVPGEKGEDYHARHVRIWDESLAPTEAVVISPLDVQRIAAQVEGVSPKAAAMLNDWCVRELKSGTNFAKVPRLGLDTDLFLKDSAEEKEVLREVFATGSPACALLSNSSQVIRIHDDRGTKRVSAIMGVQPLPVGIAPILILDACGSRTAAYKFLEQKGKLVRLHAPKKSYRGMTINHIECAAGNAAYAEPDKRIALAQEVARIVIEELPAGDEVLVVTRKNHAAPLQNAIRAAMLKSGGDPDRIKFLTWGLHFATNEYSHIKHEIQVGALQYPSETNEALLRVAAEMTGTQAADHAEVEEVRVTEIDKHIEQAACRTVIRRVVDGGVQPGSTLWVMGSVMGTKGLDPDRWRALFPDAILNPSRRGAQRERGNRRGAAAVAMLVDMLMRLLGRKWSRDLWTEEIKAPASPSTLQRLLKSPKVRKGLAEHGVELVGRLQPKGRTQAMRWLMRRLGQHPL